MRNSWLILLLSLALAPSAFASSGDIEMYTVGTTGRLTIDEQGRVADVELHNKKIGKDILADYEKQIRAWRFEPVLIEGQARAVTGSMRLGLVAFRKKGEDGVRLGMRSVDFFDPPSLQATSVETSFAAKAKPPLYPGKAAREGVGATVTLAVKVDAEGKVLDVATRSVWLQGSGFGTLATQQKTAQQFAAASEKVAVDWRFARPPEGGVLLVPVRYTPPGYKSDRWMLTQPVAIDSPQWVVDATAAKEGAPRHEPGPPVSDRFRLLTQIDENRPEGFEG